MPIKNMVVVAIAAILLLYTVSAFTVYASEDEGEAGEGEGNDTAKSFGEFAWNAGLFLILGFVAYKYTIPYQARHKIKMPVRYKHVLDIHIFTSLILAAAALIHGFLLLEYATLLEYAIGAVIVFMVVTGVVLRWSKHRKLKMYARLLHTQRALALTLLILVTIHTTLRGE